LKKKETAVNFSTQTDVPHRVHQGVQNVVEMVEQEIQNVDETNTIECNTHLTQKDFYYHGMELKVKIYSF
jgi:hypothetical protein